MTVAHRRHKDALYEQLARVSKALASPKRLELLDLLAQAPRTVEELAGAAGLSVANASQHLKLLRESRLVESSRRGLHDVRPAEEFRAGHIPGARSIPLPELQSRLGELPPGVTIVAYCRGPYCVYAADAVDLLQRNGHAATRMDQGVPEWRSQSWPIAGHGEASL